MERRGPDGEQGAVDGEADTEPTAHVAVSDGGPRHGSECLYITNDIGRLCCAAPCCVVYPVLCCAVLLHTTLGGMSYLLV